MRIWEALGAVLIVVLLFAVVMIDYSLTASRCEQYMARAKTLTDTLAVVSIHPYSGQGFSCAMVYRR